MRAVAATLAVAAGLSSRAALFCRAGSLPGVDDRNEAGFIKGIRVNSVELFYSLFESRSAPETDPVIVWFSGGPGCSSQLALFGENGPYTIDPDDLSLAPNPYSWTEAATVIWVDQPAGTGFSHGMLAPTEAILAHDAWELLQALMVKHPEYAELDLYIFGESYAGHYVPVIAKKVVDMNEQLAAMAPEERASSSGSSYLHLNLVGAAIGNGLTHPLIQYLYYGPYAKEHGLVDKKTHAFMEAVLPVCEVLTAGCDFMKTSVKEWEACVSAYVFCNMGEIAPVQNTGVNPYDVREQCDPAQPLCYDFSPIERYLNQPEVQAALGTTGRKWATCNRMVDMALILTGDWMHSYDSHVAALLESGIRVLVYAGEHDFICNWLGNKAWTKALRWRHTMRYNYASNQTWTVDMAVSVDGKEPAVEPVEAGSFKSAEGLTFLKVKGAGHMVPKDQPAASLQLVKDFFADKFGRSSGGVADIEEMEVLERQHGYYEAYSGVVLSNDWVADGGDGSSTTDLADFEDVELLQGTSVFTRAGGSGAGLRGAKMGEAPKAVEAMLR